MSKDIFTINNISEIEENKISAQIKINVKHEVFKGHFPDNPIVPGVITTKMVSEVLQKFLNKKLDMIAGDNIKFMSMIQPNKVSELTVNISYSLNDENIYKIKSDVRNEETIFLKFSGKFKE